ncbi:transposase [Streptomyces sp. NPDC004365]
MVTWLWTAFEQPDADAVRARCGTCSMRWRPSCPRAWSTWMPRSNDLLASAVFPRGIWRQIWSAPQGRLNKEICRRTEVPGILPDRTALRGRRGAGRAGRRVSRS